MGAIISNTFLMFLVTVLSFGLFFFNVPYWTGNEMVEVAHNGVYRLFYVLCSNIGWWIYQIMEKISNLLRRLFHIPDGHFLGMFVNLMLYVFAVFALSAGYDYIMSSVIGGEVSELKIADGTAYSKLSDLLLYWHIITNFAEVNSVGSFFVALKESLFGIVIFIVGTIIFFSAMYGLLVQKTKELCLIERVSKGGFLERLMDYEPETPSLKTLPKQIIAGIVEFFNKLSVLRNFKFLGVQITFCGFLFVYSFVKTLLGDRPDFQELAMDLLDEMDIINVIVSFIIAFVGAKLTAIVGRVVYKVLPGTVQRRLHDVSVRGNAAVNVIKRRRDEWSSKFDDIYRRTQVRPHWEGTAGEVHEMHLD